MEVKLYLIAGKHHLIIFLGVVGTSATYTVGASEEGKSIKAVISYQDAQGFDETVTTSNSCIPYVDDGVAEFFISGNAEVGETVTLSEDKSDPDGNGGFTYQWESIDGINWENIGEGLSYEITL